MFKNIDNKIAMLFMAAFVASSIVGCQESDFDNLNESQDQGAVVFNITRSASSSSELPDDTTLRIYNSSDRLIARYTVDEIPDAIYLAEGSYSATVAIGEEVEISENIEDISYFGEQDFTIVGGNVSDLNIQCTVQNTVVAVVFDQTVCERFELEAVSYLSLSNSFSFDDAKGGTVPTLSFTADGTGYFILPEEVNNISWGFYGESAEVDSTTATPSTTAYLSGVIENAQAATKYTLKFAYTPTADGSLALTVTVDEDAEEFNDLFSFSPQPTFAGVDFDLFAEGLSFVGDDIEIDVTSINELSDLSISSSDFTSGDILVMESGAVNSIDGVSFEMSDTKTGVLTLSQEFFTLFGSYETHTIRLSATDTMDSEGHEDMSILTSGVTTPTFDLWNNSSLFSAEVLLPDVSSVKFAYKASDSDTWQEVEAVKGEGNSYSATAYPTWSQSTNSASLTTYTLATGFSAESSYDYKLIVDGAEFAAVYTTTASGQTITNGDLNSSSIKAYKSLESSDSTDWASGNNTFSSDLCSQATKDGRVCAYLKSRTAATVFAAGNLAYGQFAMSGMSGTMSFGQSFTWESRPRTFNFSYAATIGEETHDDDNRLDGTDVARVYFAIVDWSDRHGVTAGSSGNPTGAWDPATQTSTDEGEVIGYASLLITESADSFVDVEIPIYYYDYSTKPSGDISIVISCAASAYGDYMTGSTDSRLWVDDFALGY
ncbi:MAG: DUF4493 domain-containing protein [Rikenellaceae bacterium]